MLIIVSHVVDIKQFSREDFERLFNFTQKLDEINITNSGIAVLLFFEPSTRTRGSFEVAASRNGLQSVHSADPRTSSVAKGESLHDTLTMMAGYEPSIVVMRHPQAGSSRFGSQILDRYGIPLINGGDDGHQHPTQALLDLYTIRQAYDRIDGLNIAFMGDHKHGRTASSLAEGLACFDGVHLYFIGPNDLQMTHRPEILRYLREKGIPFDLLQTTDGVLPELDVLYVTRVQKERFDDPSEYEAVTRTYVVDKKFLSRAKGELIVMHPLPRVNEIHPEIDDTCYNWYFRQAANGLPVRTVLIHLLTSGHLQLESYGFGNETGYECLNPRCITHGDSPERQRGFVQPRLRLLSDELVQCTYCDRLQTRSREPYQWDGELTCIN